jgi:hypothetical protein
MTINLPLPERVFTRLARFFAKQPIVLWCLFLSLVISIGSIAYVFSIHGILAYGDAESHLNIAKRVISGLTPGLAQLGGIWLPLPHLLMVPLVWNDYLWRSGLAGSVISGISFCISAVIVFQLTKFFTRSNLASFVAFIAFVTNLNMLYMQATPMTELSLILFMLLSTYYFVRYLSEGRTYPLVLAGIFGFLASISRYDGWFLVLLEGLLIVLYRFPYRTFMKNLMERKITLFAFLTERGEGEAILFATVALIGIIGWFIWGFVILGDPLYFTNSQFSAKSQQQGFFQRGELPAYHNLPLATLYYLVTTLGVSGVMVFLLTVAAVIVFLHDKSVKYRWYILALLMAPFFFNVITLFLGQSIIFIPHITPVGFQWRLFNVRYGLLMIPMMAVLIGYLFSRVKTFGRWLIVAMLFINLALYGVGYARVITYDDGVTGLSHSSHPDAEHWLSQHYDGGLVLLDDYARTMSIIGSGVPMQDIVYVGSHAYWDEALVAPERKMRWIVMQKGDVVWTTLYDDPKMQGDVYKYFKKVYTSDTILIFERIQ